MNISMNNDTIIAPSTPYGLSAVSLIRLSGKKSISLTNKIFLNKDLNKVKSHTVHFGTIKYNNSIIDEVLVSIFKSPRSYTKENVVEISCHGSPYITNKIISIFIKLGVRIANKGEFTFRSFLNGNMDLSQAEAVADLISSNSKNSHKIALNHVRGNFSKKIQELRNELIDFSSLIELELDFSEEDVEFANRDKLSNTVNKILEYSKYLIDSYDATNVLKNGIEVVISGKPNVGKSTILNALINEEKAIVSSIPGTTRDIIEDTITIGGNIVRFFDTAGIRKAKNKIEKIGVNKGIEKAKNASIIIYIFDLLIDTIDLNINKNIIRSESSISINQRHYDSLSKVKKAMENVKKNLKGKSNTDLIALDIKYSLSYLGEITGEITNDDVLSNIFSKFCIGK